MMRRIFVLFCLLLTVLLPTVSTGAQEQGKVYRIGYLAPNSVSEHFCERLAELGYVEGKNLIIEKRISRSKRHLLPELAAELVRLNLDLILTVGTSHTRAAKNATDTIPIVMANSSADPVRQGLVESLARPGGNVTGIFDIMADLAGKRLELLKQAFPKLSRVAHLSARSAVPAVAHLEKTETAARALGIRVQALPVSRPDDLENAFRAAVDGGAEALVVVGVSFFIPHHKRIIELEIKHRLPAIHTHQRWVPAGGLMTYTTDGAARYRRAAEYVDKILKGKKPADLPVEQPTKFLMEINLKTAKEIGVTIPPNLLVRANKVIK